MLRHPRGKRSQDEDSIHEGPVEVLEGVRGWQGPLRVSLHRLVVSRASSLGVQFFRYLFVGGAAFVVDYGSLFALTEFAGIHYLVSAAVAFLAGLCVNYVLSIGWVFDRHRLSSRWAEFTLFGLIGVVGLALNEGLMWGLTDGVGLHYLVSKLLAASLVLCWNFLARRYSLFR